MRELLAAIERVAASDVTVLIEGETGSGKELVAEAIHARSLRSKRPWVVCDLGATNPAQLDAELFGRAPAPAEAERQGAFTLAASGTLFLDEIGSLNAISQPLLLRAIERKQIKPSGSELYQEVDVRIIASTKHDLLADVRAGLFRDDLYHRLTVVRLRVPPLRERREDVPLLVEHFLRALCAERGLRVPQVSARALWALTDYAWPGNVRELRNVLERALSLAPDGSEIDIDRLGMPGTWSAAAASDTADAFVPFKDAKDQLVDRWERQYLSDLLNDSRGNISQAARRAGLARGHLHRLLRKHRLSRVHSQDSARET
jgi:two-component system nitrogen regulation response regulator GlnG